jgi:hypothetical protein
MADTTAVYYLAQFWMMVLFVLTGDCFAICHGKGQKDKVTKITLTESTG